MKKSEREKELEFKLSIALSQLHGLCSACAHYSAYHNRGKCKNCCYEHARHPGVEVNDNWEWNSADWNSLREKEENYDN